MIERYCDHLKKGLLLLVVIGIAVAIGIIAVLITTESVPGATAGVKIDGATVKVFKPDEKPYGQNYANLTAEWWKRVQQDPVPVNVLNDKTGERCQAHQDNPNVFFLYGNVGGKVERKCDVPAGKAILVCVICAEMSKAEMPGATDAELLKAAIASNTGAILSATLNGVEIPNLEDYRVRAGPFTVCLPTDNIWGVKEGCTKEFSDGYWIFMQPLPPGDHVLHLKGSRFDPTSGQTFATETITSLTVK
jgi:hypothetical protein